MTAEQETTYQTLKEKEGDSYNSQSNLPVPPPHSRSSALQAAIGQQKWLGGPLGGADFASPESGNSACVMHEGGLLVLSVL